MQIAVDGPAGSGKSTIAKIIAEKLKLTYLDTGAMYRGITLAVLSDNIDINDKEAIIEIASKTELSFENQQLFINGTNVEVEIRTPQINRAVSDVAKIREVREILVKAQQAIAKNKSVIMDGRDIGSVVLPDASYKFYLHASVDERASRRHKELISRGISQSFEEIKKEIEIRDELDKNRKEGPLSIVDDAIIVDTTGKNIEEVTAELLSYIDMQ
jgi:cytidylate kinase